MVCTFIMVAVFLFVSLAVKRGLLLGHSLFTFGTSLVVQMLKRLPIMRETRVQSLGWEDLLEKEMATHSSILAWKIPWMEEPGRLQSMGLKRVGHDWTTSLYSHLCGQILAWIWIFSKSYTWKFDCSFVIVFMFTLGGESNLKSKCYKLPSTMQYRKAEKSDEWMMLANYTVFCDEMISVLSSYMFLWYYR